jgi:hypothetical protein
MSNTTTLYRPTGPKELALVAASGYTKWPPRLPDQPIFYPVTNEEYAIQIARDWNVPASGSGYVTKFEVRAEFMARYQIHTVELEELNANIVGLIEVTREFKK